MIAYLFTLIFSLSTINTSPQNPGPLEKNFEKSRLHKLADNDSVVVNFSTVGCFHSASSKIVITKKGNNLLAELYLISDRNIVPTEDTTKNELAATRPVKTSTLTAEHVNAYDTFEKELSVQKDLGCTTIDMYEINSKDLNLRASDGSCSWHGFMRLSNIFFGG